jgi:hypothetical protein
MKTAGSARTRQGACPLHPERVYGEADADYNGGMNFRERKKLDDEQGS